MAAPHQLPELGPSGPLELAALPQVGRAPGAASAAGAAAAEASGDIGPAEAPAVARGGGAAGALAEAAATPPEDEAPPLASSGPRAAPGPQPRLPAAPPRPDEGASAAVVSPAPSADPAALPGGDARTAASTSPSREAATPCPRVGDAAARGHSQGISSTTSSSSSSSPGSLGDRGPGPASARPPPPPSGPAQTLLWRLLRCLGCRSRPAHMPVATGGQAEDATPSQLRGASTGTSAGRGNGGARSARNAQDPQLPVRTGRGPPAPSRRSPGAQLRQGQLGPQQHQARAIRPDDVEDFFAQLARGARERRSLELGQEPIGRHELASLPQRSLDEGGIRYNQPRRHGPGPVYATFDITGAGGPGGGGSRSSTGAAPWAVPGGAEARWPGAAGAPGGRAALGSAGGAGSVAALLGPRDQLDPRATNEALLERILMQRELHAQRAFELQDPAAGRQRRQQGGWPPARQVPGSRHPGSGGGGRPGAGGHFAGLSFGHGAGDIVMSEEGLQEVIEQSRRAHLMHELPRETFDPDRHKELVECDLCLEDYKAGDELMRLPCMHLFHSACVAPWMQKSYTCPVCQTDACKAVGL